jgi:multiple antibiotic resistance protein
MERDSYIFTIFFLLLGPIKLIFPFAATTRGLELPLKRKIAIQAAAISTLVVILLWLLGQGLLLRYEITVNALQLAGGIILFLSALKSIFSPKELPEEPSSNQPNIMQTAVNLAVPGIVPPVGIAAILIFVMLSAERPTMQWYVLKNLLVVMGMNFLVMFFNHKIVRVPGLPYLLQITGAVLVFIQAALAMQAMVLALRNLGLIAR